MNPTIEVYYDPSRLPLPPVVGWLETLGIVAIHRTPKDAPQEWLERYGCCFPWVVADGRIVLKAGFQKAHLERLAQRWFGSALVAWWRTPKQVPQGLAAERQQESYCDQDFFWSSTSGNRSDGHSPRKIQIWDSSAGASLPLARLVLDGFRQGWRPVVVWLLLDQPPHLPTIVFAQTQLQDRDLLIIKNKQGQAVLLGMRAWHGELFEDGTESDPLNIDSIAKKAHQLKLALGEFEFDEAAADGNALPIAMNDTEKRI